MRIALAGPARPTAFADLVDGAIPDVEPISGATPVTHLARSLHAAGHHVHVVTLASGLEDTRSVTGGRFRLDICPNRSRHRARDAFSAERAALRGALDASDADVIHAHWTYEFALAAQATGRPTLVTARDWAPTVLRYQRHPYRLVRLGMNTVVLRRASVVTVTSPYMLRRVAGWTSAEVHLVPNAVPDEDFARRRPARGPRPVIVALNNGFGARKNVTSLLEAFPAVRRRHPDASLELIGAGFDEGGDAHRWAREHGLADGVRFRGPLDHDAAMATLATASVFAHPSREESFGLVLLEAMARFVPVVAGQDSGAVPWVCDEGRAAVLTDIEDPAALAAAITTVTGSPTLADRITAHAHEWAWQRFRVSAARDAYVAIYERMLHG